MLQKFLKESVGSIVGKNFENIVDILFNKKHVNEFLIAKKLNVSINQARNILYKLQDQGLVSSIRKKDKRKGWYTYFWKFENLKGLELLKNIYLKKIEQVKNLIGRYESEVFYICKRCNLEFTESDALLYDFTCPECGEVFSIKDNTDLLKQLNKNLKKFEEILEEINKQIEKEEAKIEKEKMKELAKVSKEKTSKKATKKKAVKKKTVKKVVKKKVSKKTTKATKKKTVKKKTVKKVVKKKTTSKKTAKRK